MLVRSLRWVPPTTALAVAEDNEEALRIIKGRPFEVVLSMQQNSTERSTRMEIKYIGMNVHKETISIAVMNREGRVVMESIIRNQGEHDLAVYPGGTRGLACDVRRGDLGGLVV